MKKITLLLSILLCPLIFNSCDKEEDLGKEVEEEVIEDETVEIEWVDNAYLTIGGTFYDDSGTHRYIPDINIYGRHTETISIHNDKPFSLDGYFCYNLVKRRRVTIGRIDADLKAKGLKKIVFTVSKDCGGVYVVITRIFKDGETWDLQVLDNQIPDDTSPVNDAGVLPVDAPNLRWQ